VPTDAQGHFNAYMPANESGFSVTVEAIGVGRRTLGGTVPSNGVLDIVLDAVGGTLVLDFADLKGDDLWKTAQRTFFLHDGGIDNVAGLKRWSEVNGEPVGGSVLRAPLMSPGFYRVCQVVGLSEVDRLIADALPKQRCRGGYLPPGGELQLQVPPLSPTPAR